MWLLLGRVHLGVLSLPRVVEFREIILSVNRVGCIDRVAMHRNASCAARCARAGADWTALPAAVWAPFLVPLRLEVCMAL